MKLNQHQRNMDNGIEPMPRNMITRTKLFESKLQKYQWSRILSETKGPAQEILNESSRNPDPRSRNLQLWSWKINSPKINASYYSKFQSLGSRYATWKSKYATWKSPVAPRARDGGSGGVPDN